MKLIYLTALVTTPNKMGEEKIEKASKVNREESQIDYHSLGIRPPKGEVEKDEYGNIILDEEDFEEVGVPVTIPLKNISSYVATLEGDTIVYTNNGVSYNVAEEVWEINAYIQLLTMSWASRNWEDFKYWISNKKETENGLQD